MLWELVVQFDGAEGDTLRLAAPGRLSRRRQVRTWHPLSPSTLARLVAGARVVDGTCMLCPRDDTGSDTAIPVTDVHGSIAEIARLLGWPGATGGDWLLAAAARLIDPVSAVDSGVSVVIPVCDSEIIDPVVGSVVTAFEALLARPRWECVVVDGSGGQLEVSGQDWRVSVLHWGQRLSRGSASNLGLGHAKYETVLFCDPDILLPANYFAVHLPWQCVAPNVITVGTDGSGTWRTIVTSAELARRMLFPPSDPDDIAASCAALGCFVRQVPETTVVSVREPRPDRRGA